MCLRPLTLADAQALHRIWTLAEVRRHLWDDEVISLEKTCAVLTESERLYTSEGTGLWGIFPGNGPTLGGFCGYFYFFDPPQLQLIYGLAPRYWARGLASEAARAMVQYGFETLKLEYVIAATDPPNAASLKVMQKLKMVFEKKETHDGQTTVFYRLDRPLDFVGAGARETGNPL